MFPIKCKLNCLPTHNSRILTKVQLRGIKREACYAESKIMFRITFFPGTINSENYKPQNLNEFNRNYGCSQDDCPTVRATNQ